MGIVQGGLADLQPTTSTSDLEAVLARCWYELSGGEQKGMEDTSSKGGWKRSSGTRRS